MDDSSIRPAFNKITFDQVALDTWLKMRDARANKDVYKEFVYFDSELDLLATHLPKEFQDFLEVDYTHLYKMIDKVNDGPEADATKETKIMNIKRIFMETHKRYISLAFPRSGITKPEDDATLDFSEVDYTIMRKIIRSKQSGSGVVVREALKNEDILGDEAEDVADTTGKDSQ